MAAIALCIPTARCLSLNYLLLPASISPSVKIKRTKYLAPQLGIYSVAACGGVAHFMSGGASVTFKCFGWMYGLQTKVQSSFQLPAA